MRAKRARVSSIHNIGALWGRSGVCVIANKKHAGYQRRLRVQSGALSFLCSKCFPNKCKKKLKPGRYSFLQISFYSISCLLLVRFGFFWILLLFLGSSYFQIAPPLSWRSSPVLLASLGSVWLLLALPARRISRRVFLRPGPSWFS